MGSGCATCFGKCGKGKPSAKYQETEKQASIPFLAEFGLCMSDLENKGDYQFPIIQSAETQMRGGFPYYQPVLGTRYGIKVAGVYGEDNWLLMDHNKGEWAIAFHGIRNPENLINGKPAFRCIMDGRKDGLMLRPGENQAYAYKMCANFPSQKVGVGVYLSPHCQTSLLDYTTPVTMAGQTYHIVLICRVKPDKVRICADMQDYWVVKQAKDIRPYGIILFTPNQFKQIQRYRASQGGTHQRFNWQAARQTYKEFICQ